MNRLPVIRRGRGAAVNPPNRFESLHLVRDAWTEAEDPAPETCFLTDASRSILTRNESPDVGFEYSVNPYRGCEHGCSYCYARPTHEYLGFSAGLDFETKILVKERAPELLREKLRSAGWSPAPIAMSGVTDPYQPVERRLEITRRCLAVLADFYNPVVIVTKNHLVTRDLDHLARLAEYDAVKVLLSVTTLRPRLARVMEPRASTPSLRLQAIERLAEAGVPVGVMMAPLIPGLTDTEIPAVLEAAADAGARQASYVMLRLPFGVSDLFESWLEDHFPERKTAVLNKLRRMRGGKLNDPRFGHRMRGEGAYARQIHDLFGLTRRKVGLDGPPHELTTEHFCRPGEGKQLALGI